MGSCSRPLQSYLPWFTISTQCFSPQKPIEVFYPPAIWTCRQFPNTPFSVLSPSFRPCSSLRQESSLQPVPVKLLLSSQDSSGTQLPLWRPSAPHRLCFAFVVLGSKVSRPSQREHPTSRRGAVFALLTHQPLQLTPG